MMFLAPLVVGLALAAPAPPSPEARLEAAVALFDQLNDEAAAAALRELLAQKPPTAIAAKAHLYLGLIALNGANPDVVRSEFHAALQTNPAVELPPRASPKARTSFLQARNAYDRELMQGSLASPVVPPPAPAAASSAPLAAVTASPEAPKPNDHLVSWVLIAVGVGAAATAVIGAVQVLNYDSQVSSAQSQAAVGSPNTQMSQLISGQNAANFWSKAWLPFALGGALAGGAAVVVW